MLDLQIGEGVFCILGDEIRHPVGVHRGGGNTGDIAVGDHPGWRNYRRKAHPWRCDSLTSIQHKKWLRERKRNIKTWKNNSKQKEQREATPATPGPRTAGRSGFVAGLCG